MDRRDRFGAMAGCLGPALVLAAGSCWCAHAAHGADDRGVMVQPAQASGWPELDALAVQQAAVPDAAAVAVARELLPAGVVQELPSADSPARLPLEAAVERLVLAGPSAPPEAPTDDGREVSPERKLQAQRWYASAKLLRLEGQDEQAVPLLEAASKLDPAAGDVLRELGLALRQLGRRSAALNVMRKAAALGQDDPAMLWALAREEARSGDEAVAAALLVRAWRGLADGSSEPGVTMLIETELGAALGRAGFVAASAQMLERALDKIGGGVGPAGREPDIADVLRRRAELWLKCGDGWAGVGDTERALRAYERASQATNFDPAAMTRRRVGLLLAQGLSARAAAMLIADVRTGGAGTINPAWLEQARAVATRTQAGPAFARAVESVLGQMQDATPSDRARWAVLGASLMTDAGQRAQRLLRATDELGARREILRELFDLESPVRDRAAWCVRALKSDPVGVTVIAEEIIAAGRDVDALHAALLARGDCGGHVVAACVAVLLGDAPRAQQHLDEAICAGTDPALAARALVAHALPPTTDSADARPGEESSEDPATLALWRRVAAHGLANRGQAGAAAEAFAALRDDARLRVWDCLRAASVSDAAGAKAWLARAQERDPRDEDVYAARIALHQPSGRAPDMGELLAVVRDLRANVPGSKIVRLSMIRETAERGGWREALGQLREVIDDRGTPNDGCELWALVVEEASRSDAGQAEAQVAWMRGLRQARPDSPVLTGALARGLVSIGRADEAEAMLRSFLARWPEPGLRTGLEYVLREGLGRKDEADTLAIARLSEPPATEDKLIELTGLLATRGEFAQARQRVGEIKSRAGLRRLADLARAVSVRRAADGQASTPIDAAAFIDAVRDAGALTKPQAAMMRADLLLRSEPLPSAELLAAVEEAAGGVAAAREQILRRITDALRAREDQRPLLRLLGEIVVSDPANNSERGQEWLLRTAASGHIDDARWLVERMSDQAVAKAVLSGMQDGILEVMELEKDRKATAAYTMGNLAQGFGRERMAHDCYALTLEHDPGHAWAANNLGYLMLERGGDLAQSAALIERAIEKLPGEASVIDSLGWLRYKQGKLTSRGADVDFSRQLEMPADHAAMLELGAAEALLLASQQPDAATNEELADHLGDVAWRLGNKQEAQKHWKAAVDRGSRRLAATPDVPWMRHDRARLKVFVENVRAKVRAAEGGGEPVLAAEKPPEVFTPHPEPEPIRFDRPEEAFMPENGLQLLEP